MFGIGILEFLVIVILVGVIIVPAVLVPILSARRGPEPAERPRSRAANSRRREAQLKALLHDGLLTRTEYEEKLRILRRRA